MGRPSRSLLRLSVKCLCGAAPIPVYPRISRSSRIPSRVILALVPVLTPAVVSRGFYFPFWRRALELQVRGSLEGKRREILGVGTGEVGCTVFIP